MPRILIGHPNADIAIHIQRLLQSMRELGGCYCEIEANGADIANTLAGAGDPFDMLVIAVAIPENKSSISNPGVRGRRGIELATTLRGEGNHIPILLVADSPDEVNLEELGYASITNTGLDWEREFKNAFRELRSGSAKTSRNHPLNMDIWINLSTESPHCVCHMVAEGTPFDGYYPLNLSRNDLKDLVGSVSTPSETDWESNFQKTGRNLYKRIFSEKPDLLTAFQKYGGPEAARIRINVETSSDQDRPVHEIPFEAINDDVREGYWMLSAPIFRRLNKPIARWPLFKDAKSRGQEYVNCLIIESDVEGRIPAPINQTLRRLENAAEESAALKEFFAKQSGNKKLGKVRRFPQDFNVSPEHFVERLESVMKENPWHLIHYIGHTKLWEETTMDNKTKEIRRIANGYLILPERTPYSMQRFVDLLKIAETQFLFLSSCEAASYEFLWEASREVPAVLGFRWGVADRDAREFAMVFYKKLFGETRFLEYAFTKARQEMYLRNRDPVAKQPENSSIWASPVLLMQASVTQTHS